MLKRDGSAWTTDKDGIILGLLAAEITAVTGKDPANITKTSPPNMATRTICGLMRRDASLLKAAFKQLTGERVSAQTLAREAITARLTRYDG